MKTTNYSKLIGTVETIASFSHGYSTENFYRFIISVKRTSGNIDYIPVIFSDYIFDKNNLIPGMRLGITGQLRTYNQNRHLLINLLANKITETTESEDSNKIYLCGFTCKKSNFRTTPLGRRIADITLAVNRANGSDYLPIIAWSKNALIAKKLDVGTYMEIEGRIQSREYTKMYEDGTSEIKTAYEVSVTTLNTCQ